MYLNITAHQMHNSKALQNYVNNKINKDIKKYVKDFVGAYVTFKKTKGNFKTLIIINNSFGTHQNIQSHALSDSVYTSFNMAMERIVKQLRRYKRKVSDHKNAMPLRKIVG